MDDGDVLRITGQPGSHGLADEEQRRERGWEMIRPSPIQDAGREFGFIVLLLTQIEDEIMIGMSLVQQLHDIVDVVPVDTLDPGRRQSHRDDSFRDVRQVKIQTIIPAVTHTGR